MYKIEYVKVVIPSGYVQCAFASDLRLFPCQLNA